MSALVGDRGVVVISGVLDHQLAEVEALYPTRRADLLVAEGEWIALRLTPGSD